MTRIGALADLHLDPGNRSDLVRTLKDAEEEVDVLCIAGDLTTHGEPEQIRGVAELLGGELDVPVIAVLGNHDHESGRAEEALEILTDHGVHVLQGDAVVVDGIGFAGAKGFCGGFGRGAMAGFGEKTIKVFVQEALDEAMALENALRKLHTDVKVALLHYSPVQGTVEGEPETIWPFLGSSRLAPPLDDYDVDVCFHGHAHTGSAEGRTAGGVPVYNVALPLLRTEGLRCRVWEVEAGEPERASAPETTEVETSKREAEGREPEADRPSPEVDGAGARRDLQPARGTAAGQEPEEPGG